MCSNVVSVFLFIVKAFTPVSVGYSFLNGDLWRTLLYDLVKIFRLQ